MTPSISLTLSKKKRKSVVGQSQTHYIYITWIQREKNKPWELHVMVVVRADCSNWLRGYSGLSWPFFFTDKPKYWDNISDKHSQYPYTSWWQVHIFSMFGFSYVFGTGEGFAQGHQYCGVSPSVGGDPLLGMQVFRVGGYWEGSKISMYAWKLFYLLRLVQRKCPIQREYSFWPVYCYINILYDILLC